MFDSAGRTRNPLFVQTPSGSFAIIKPGIHSSSLDRSGSGATTDLINVSGSIHLALDPNDTTSFILSGSGATKLYFSGSGKMGFNTTNPEVDFDIRSDDFKIRKKSIMAGIRMNADGNLESFNNVTTAAATGSELIMKYTRGSVASGGDEEDADEEFSDKSEVQIGDVLGSIRWVVDSGSIDQRVAGEVANIQTIAAATQAVSAGVVGKMLFKISQAPDVGPVTMLTIDGLAELVTVTGSISGTGNLKMAGSQVDFTNLPTSDPSAAGRLWRSGNDVKISTG